MNFTPIHVNSTFSGLKSRWGEQRAGFGDALVGGASVCFASVAESFLTNMKTTAAP